MTTRAKLGWGWVAVLAGLLTIGGKVVATSMYVQDLASRMGFAEQNAKEQKRDLEYIRGRVDDIYKELKDK